MKIGIDIDGTLAEPMEILCGIYGIEIPDKWNYFQTIGESEKFNKDFESVWRYDWKSVPLIENDSPTIIDKILNLGHSVDIVTAGYGEFKQKWLKMHKFQYGNIIDVEHGIDKAKYDYDVFIDDAPPNFDAFMKAGKTCAVFDRPWNVDIYAEFRIRSIGEIIPILSII